MEVPSPFDCGVHTCSKPCHTPSPTPAPCPRAPAQLTHCPCGKHALSPNSADFFKPGAKLVRTACTDAIPTCTSTCMRPLDGCSHVCAAPCHTGACPPCATVIVRPCRCGAVTRSVRCADLRAPGAADGELLCDRPCPALRACGRHRCNRICCPLAALAGGAKTKKRRAGPGAASAQEADDDTGLHACDLVCGKMLGCGNHPCEERDHRGPCPPCLRSSFEEVRALSRIARRRTDATCSSSAAVRVPS
jgi:transcriptional repressor NF-X1